MTTPGRLLSIILPVYNEAKSLKVMVQILEAAVEMEHEVLIVYDSPEDRSVGTAEWLKKKYPNVRPVLNDTGRGVGNAIHKGITAAAGDIVLVTLVDEVFPIAAIDDMAELIKSGCDMVSCTRYALGGKRYGGSFIGGLLSRNANLAFRLATGSVLTDATTGIKMFRKSIFEKITIEAKIGWAFAFEVSIKAQILGLRIGEVPVVSVDRLFGGDSTFKLGSWVKEYLKWFFWGVKELNRIDTRQSKVVTIEDIRG